MKITIREDGAVLFNKQQIGFYLPETLTFMTSRKMDKHFYRALNGFAFNEDILKLPNIKWIVVNSTDIYSHTGISYKIKVSVVNDLMRKYGCYISNKVNDTLIEKQIVIPIELMDRSHLVTGQIEKIGIHVSDFTGNDNWVKRIKGTGKQMEIDYE